MLNDLIKAKNWTLDLLFPILCVGCGKEGKYICDDCSVFLSENAQICPVCQKTSLSGERHEYCKKDDELDGLTTIWDYEGIAKVLMRRIKKEGLFHAIPVMVCESFSVIANDKNRFKEFLSFLSLNDACVSYVPSHGKEEKKRGFNHAELIAREVGRFTGLQIINSLEKTRQTKLQEELGSSKRFSGAKASFAARGKCPENVILVDDFWTTGATMKECCRVLKENGAENVWGFVFSVQFNNSNNI